MNLHSKIDRQAVIQNNPINVIIGRFIKLTKKGRNYIACCPFHNENTPSFTVSTEMQMYKCFGCGESGNVIDFVMKHKSISFREACELIDSTAVEQEQPKQSKRKAKATDAVPDQNKLPQSFRHIRHGEPSTVWPWRNKNGQITHFTCRFDNPTGKEILPYTYKSNGWQWAAPESPRPIYNLDVIHRNPNAKIMVVEGEKTADAVARFFPADALVVTTWLGGVNAIPYTDFTPLHGRSVFLWPDNDVQGLSAMLQIQYILGERSNVNGIMPLNYSLPKGWDAADREWTKQELTDAIMQSKTKTIDSKNGIYSIQQVGEQTVYEFGLIGDKWQHPKKIEGITASEPDAIIPLDAIPLDNEQQVLDAIKFYIDQNHSIKRNAITYKLEDNGREITDQDINTLFLKCRYAFNSKKISREIVETYLYSGFIETYHPIKEFIKNHRHVQTTGNIQKLIDSVITDTPDAAIYIRKWLLQLPAALDFKPFRSVLIMVGGQNTGKTWFFRHLLPPDLLGYYSESKLDAGKDDQLLMCENWLILDDEMGGKSKKDEKMFKDLTSKKEFSLRAAYAKSNQKYKRLAVLCGTSNDTQLINDPTGNTRMLPVNVLGMNHDLYNSIDKIALLMEIYRAYEAGDKWELTREELERLEDTSEAFRPAAFERELIQKFFQKGDEMWTFTEIKIKIELETGQKIFNSKLFTIELRRLFGESKKCKRNGNVDRVYFVAPSQAVNPNRSANSQSVDNQEFLY